MGFRFEEAARSLLTAATLAPSGDNLQPWTFVCDASRRSIRIKVDPLADTSPMNSGQRMSHVALGALWENVRVTAGANGWSLRETLSPSSDELTFEFQSAPRSPARIPQEILDRCTNRRIYQGGSIDDSLLDSLREIGESPTSRCAVLADRFALKRAASLIGRSDALMFSKRDIFRAFAESVQVGGFEDRTARGLNPSCLEIGQMEARALKRYAQIAWPFDKALPLPFFIGRRSRSLVLSSAGLVCLIVKGNTLSSFVEAGQKLQALWLELTRRGLSAQLMMSLPILENRLGLDGERAENLVEESHSLFAMKSSERIGCLFRFGQALPPSGRTGRLSLNRTAAR